MRVGTTIVVPFWLAVSQKSDYLRILQPVSLKASVVNPEPMSILPSQADCSVVDIKSPYRIVSGQSDEWRLLFFVRLAIERLTAARIRLMEPGFSDSRRDPKSKFLSLLVLVQRETRSHCFMMAPTVRAFCLLVYRRTPSLRLDSLAPTIQAAGEDERRPGINVLPRAWMGRV
jgi:hypothetical protein